MTQRNTIQIFSDAKRDRQKVTMVTCYDSTMAKIVDSSGIDSILIGDSMGMTMLGFDSTLPVTLDHIITATRAVVSATENVFVVADMPFMSYQASVKDGIYNAGKLIAQGGAGAVKIEGAARSTCVLISELIDSGIPVIGHLGLTPQSVNMFGGYKAQGRDLEEIAALFVSCEQYAEAGVSAVVLECVPAELAKHITKTFPFATIGIGAGPDCDGEVQVLQDILGLCENQPKHSHNFINGAELLGAALSEYNKSVKDKSFPTKENSVHISPDMISQAEDYLDDVIDSFLGGNEFIDN